MLQQPLAPGKFLIPIDWMIGIALLQTLGSVMAGTGFFFATCSFLILLLCGFTYNLLGGFGHPGGIIFLVFALRTFVISQFAKVIFFESAEAHLEAPHDTIIAYLCFFAAAAVGIYLAKRISFRFFAPFESDTSSSFYTAYFLCLSFCVFFWISGFDMLVERISTGVSTVSSSLFVLVAPLLYFSIILTVDHRIRISNGRKSVDLYLCVLGILSALMSFMNSSRATLLSFFILYLVTCVTRGYRFKIYHYVGLMLVLVVFLTWFSPFILYMRGEVAQKNLHERLYLLVTYFEPSNNPWDAKDKLPVEGNASNYRESYYNRKDTRELSRISLIRSDSNMVAATNSGYHYGWTSFMLDALMVVPNVLYPGKPHFGSAEFTGRVTGLDQNVDSTADVVISPIGEAYGAFGIWGTIFFPLFLFPLLHVFLAGSFDHQKPWGTCILLMFAMKAGETSLGQLAIGTLRLYLTLVIASFVFTHVISVVNSLTKRS